MIQVTVLSPWGSSVVEGITMTYILVSALLSTQGETCTDITDQISPIPTPNLLTCKLQVTQPTLDAIKGDSRFFVLCEEVV